MTYTRRGHGGKRYFHPNPTVKAAFESMGVEDDPALLTEVKNAPVVYALRAVGHGIKIGFTRNLPRRLKAYATHCPNRLMLVGTFRGGVELEQQLKIRFEHARIRGEWYSERILPELLDLLAEEGELIAA